MMDRDVKSLAIAPEELEMFRNASEGCAVGIVISHPKRWAVSLIFLFFSCQYKIKECTVAICVNPSASSIQASVSGAMLSSTNKM